MISTLLDRLFQRSNVPSGAKVKQRLKFILAHDRAAIEPQVFEKMRHEIMRVVSKYVELDEGLLDIRLESDKRMTALIANLPIRMVREELPDLVSLFDEPTEEVDSSNNSDALALEMDRSAEDALDAILAKENIKTTEDISPESIAVIAERTIEVTSKIRTAANKTQNGEICDRTEAIVADVVVENPANEQHEEAEELNEPTSDQLELSLGISSSLESQEIVEESPKLYNQEEENHGSNDRS